MRFLKSEWRERTIDCADMSREDSGYEQPEQLCDYDIFHWRNPEHSYNNDRRNSDWPIRLTDGSHVIRKNEIAGLTRDVNHREKCFLAIHEAFLRIIA